MIYYYTYGSVLAALDHCDKAIDVLNQVGEVFVTDEIIMEYIENQDKNKDDGGFTITESKVGFSRNLSALVDSCLI